MRTARPNSRDIAHKRQRKDREARPYARLLRRAESRDGPTIRIHAYRPDYVWFIDYEQAGLHFEACGTTLDDAATALLERIDSDTGFILAGHPPTRLHTARPARPHPPDPTNDSTRIHRTRFSAGCVWPWVVFWVGCAYEVGCVAAADGVSASVCVGVS
jgi:hypothetical protein